MSASERQRDEPTRRGFPSPHPPDLGQRFGPTEPPPSAAQLRMHRGPDCGAVYDLTMDTVTLGRHDECDIVLEDSTVSRRHAEIRRDGTGRYHLADAGSLNGTYLNREVVDRAEMRDGDEIWIGKVRFTFHLGEG